MRIAFVLARYGRSVIGGAETLARELAAEAAGSGWEVEVWTSCAVNYSTWANELPSGTVVEDGVTVRRFPVDTWDPSRHHFLNKQLAQLNGVDTFFQYDWVASGPHSSALNQYVMQNAEEFDAIIVVPYLHSITYDAAWLAGDRVVMIPCLHNELTAYMEPYRLLLESAYGVVFISPEEADFAVDGLDVRINRGAVIGSGVQLESTTDAKSQEDKPFLLYVGRLERGKNVVLLYDFVRRYAEEGGDVRLVVVGDGPCKPPEGAAFEYLGPVSDEEKNRLYAEALAVCQPSLNESFSLVIMESWLARRPALVWSACDVTRGHVQRSKGGLWFGSYDEFKASVAWLTDHKDAADRMGTNGNNYVRENFAWERVFGQFAQTLSSWGIGVRS